MGEGQQSLMTGSGELDVAEVMLSALPNAEVRQHVMHQLVTSAEEAAQHAPDAWAVTLFRDGFRLNVGQVEVLALGGGKLLVNLAVNAGSPPFDGPDFVQTDYRSMPAPQSAYLGPVERFPTLQLEIQAAHLAFVRRAAVTGSGQARRGTPFRRSHCEALLQYARNVVTVHSDDAEAALPDLSSGEESVPTELVEGARITVQINAYERNRTARDQCKAHYGSTCVVCGFSFGAAYRCAEADGYIHIHHLTPVSSVGQQYVVDPVADLRPVCANCHAVIHMRNPPYSIEEMKKLVAEPFPGTEIT